MGGTTLPKRISPSKTSTTKQRATHKSVETRYFCMLAKNEVKLNLGTTTTEHCHGSCGQTSDTTVHGNLRTPQNIWKYT